MKLLRLVLVLLLLPFAAHAQDISARVDDGYADSGGVRIHYATLGNPKDPPVLMIHGLRDAPAQVVPLVRDWLAH